VALYCADCKMEFCERCDGGQSRLPASAAGSAVNSEESIRRETWRLKLMATDVYHLLVGAWFPSFARWLTLFRCVRFPSSREEGFPRAQGSFPHGHR
jgi:hypothetical protein